MAANRYDLVVIGTGTAATSVATQLRAAKWKVAVMDHRPFGGTCQLRSCDPKKVLRSGTAPSIMSGMVGPHVDEVIDVFAFAMRHGHTADELKATVFAYPTGASDIASML